MGLFDDLLEEEDKIQPTKRRGLFDDLLEEEDLVSPTAPPRTTAPQAQLLPPIEEMFKPKPKPTGDGFFRQAADIPVGLAKGAAQGVRMFTDIAGADNPVSQSIRGVEDYLGNLMSAQAKEDQAEIARIMQDAQDKGVLDQVMAGVKAFSVAPVDMTVQALGTMAPVIAGGLAANVAKVAATGIRGGVAAARGLTAGQMAATQAGIGAGMGAGVVKGTIYDEVKNELISQGLSEDAAHQQAVKAQEYGGKNLDQILLGAGLGAAAATTGAEKIIGGILTKTGVAASKSRIGNALKTGITEAFPEAAQGAQEQLAANLALQREGMEVPTTRGVFSSGALEGIAGFGVGAPLGAIQKASVAEDAAIKAEEANAPQTAAAIRAAGQKAATTEKDISATEQAIEETEAATRPTVPIREEEPYVQPPKEEFKAAFARMTPESIAETEANFREQLQSEDEETRVFSQNALDALAEFRAEQARARKLPTDVLPTETPGATYGREADIYDVFADVRRRPMPPSGPAFESAQVIEEAARRADILRRTPEGRELLRRELQGEEMVGGVRRATEEALATAPEPAEGDVFAEIRRPSRAEEAAITIEQQLAEDERIRISQLGAEALREELAQVESLSRVADNTATDEEVVRLARQGLVNIQEGQNVITPRGEEVMQRGGAPLPRLTPEERVAEVAAAPAIVEQAPPVAEPPAVTPAPATEVEPIDSAIEVARKTNFAAAATRQEAGEIGRNIASQDPNLPPLPPPQFDVLESISNLQARRPYNPDALTEDAINEARDSGFITGKQVGKLKLTESGRNQLKEWSDQARDRDFAESSLRDEIADIAVSQWDAANDPESAAAIAARTTRPPTPVTTPPVTEAVTPAPAAPIGGDAIVAAAVRQKDGKIFSAPLHILAIEAAKESGYPTKYLDSDYGFVTKSGKFLDSKSAREYSIKQKQVDRKILEDIEASFSEEKTPELESGAFSIAESITKDIKAQKPIQGYVVEEYNLDLPKGYTKQGDLYVYQPAATPTPAAPAEAAPVGIAVGNRVKTKTTPQSFVVEEVLPQSAREAELGEQYYSIRNERTGEVQTVEAGDIKIVRGKGVRKMAVASRNEEYMRLAQDPKANREQLQRMVDEAAKKAGYDSPRVYHGSTSNIEIFDTNKIPIGDTQGSYFTDSKSYAATRGEPKSFFLKIENPASNEIEFEAGSLAENQTQKPRKGETYRADDGRLYLTRKKSGDFVKNKLESQGYDGVVREISGATTYIAFNPSQIKSADPVTYDDAGNVIPLEERFQPSEPDIRRMASELRAEEKYTPVPEADRYTFREASGRAIRFFGGEKPENFVIVNNSTDPDYEFKAGYDPDTGEIILNRAYIQRGENIEDILTHELGHYIYSDPQFQKAFQNFLESMPDDARAEIDEIVNEGYNKETNEVQIEERQVMAFASLVRKTKRGRTAWEKVKDVIKTIINRLLKTNIVLSDHGAMAVFNVGYKRFNSGERIIREMKKGTLRTAPEGMSQMDRDYLAAVERGDMETAQRMVDEAAKRAGYGIKGWHGTRRLFNTFDDSLSYTDKGFFFFDNKDEADRWAKISNRQGQERVVSAYLKIENPLVVDKKGNEFDYAQGLRMERYWADSEGRDGIVIKNVREGSKGGISTQYNVFNPDQIKSADPVTYDDAGNVIPLSQRFRATSPDIRRMAPEPAPTPEAVVEEAPAERPKRRTKMQNIIDISTGVKRPKTKLTVNEMTALKDQIKLGARKRREDKRTQREFAKDLTQQLREAAIRGKVRPSQLRAITSKALQTQFDNEASILGFVNYANKVIENANYEKDLSDAKSAIKSAKRLAKQKGLAGNIKANLEKLANIDPRQIEPEEMVEVDGEAPISVAEFTAVLKEYMKAGGPVTAEEYVLVPDAEITDFLTKLGEQIETNRKAMENLGMDGELAAIADKTPEEIDAELARDEERRNRIEQKINGLAEEAQVALVNYDNPEITPEEKIVLDDMKRITLSDISIGERKEFIKIANNILVNNKFLGAQKFASMARGQIGAVEAAKDAKTVKRNSATLKVYENLLGENFGRLVNLGTQSFADTFRNLTGTQGLPRLLYQMGFGEIERGQANTNRARREITDGVQQRFKQIEKETGQRIAETQGVYSMGVAGNLIQIHPDETEAEGIQRMRGLIEKDIEKKKKSPKTEDRKTALYVEKALDEVYADSIQGILDNLNRLHPANYKALTFLMNEVLPEYKPLLKEHDELFNNQTENYENPYYLPIRYRSIGTEPKKPGELRGRASDSVTAPKQAPNSIKRIKNSVLPEGKQFDYNLTRNVLDSLSTQLEAAYTNPGWQQVYAFLKSPEAVDALGGVENYDFVTKRINNLSDSRERRIYQMDPFNQAADFVANMVRKIGTSIALGGIGQAAKQMPDQIATTIANVNDLSITTPAFTEIKAALPAMRQFSIGERGEIAGGSKWVNQLEGNFTKLQQFMQDGLWPKAMEAFENLNNFWLIPLKISDTVAASHGWISYYKKSLKDNDIQFTNWDNESDLIAKGDRSRVEAGLYADQMIDIYQGSSDPTKMATFAQRGDSGGGNLLKTMIMPFSSFVIQQRSRILSDLRDVSYGDTDEKKVAARGLAGTLLGIIIFHGVRRYALPLLTGGVAAAAYGLLGVDMEEPDEEERLEKERRVFRQFLGEVASNIFVGGYSAYAETRLIDAVNAAAYFYEIQTQSENVLDDKGEIMSWEKYRKERAPMYRYTGPGADSTLGMLDILPSQARESFDRLKDLSDDEIMDSLTEEEQRVLILAALSETLYTMRLNDADVARMVKRMAKDVKDQAEARQKAERQLQRIYGQ